MLERMNASEAEDIAANPFFVNLKRSFPQIYRTAEENCYTICVPTTQSIGQAVNVTKDDVEYHILKPSALYQETFETLKDSSCVVQLEGDKLVLQGAAWPPTATSTRILFDELFYNKKLQPFRVVCIEKPIVSLSAALAASGDSNGSISTATTTAAFEASNLQTKMIPITTAGAAFQFLSEYAENVIVLRSFRQKHFEPFSKSFSIARGRELVSLPSIRELIEDSVDQLICANADFRLLLANKNHLRQLHVVVELYVMSILADRIFHQLTTVSFVMEDEAFYNKTLSLQSASTAYIGVRVDLLSSDPVSDLSEALALVSDRSLGLDASTIAPLQKVFLLKDSIDAIRRGLALARQRRLLADGIASPRDEESRLITTDDIIPLLAFVLIHAKLRYVHSALFMMQNFVFSDVFTSELGFNVVSFAAAYEYVRRVALPTENRPMRRSQSHSSNIAASTIEATPGRRFGASSITPQSVTTHTQAPFGLNVTSKESRPPDDRHSATVATTTNLDRPVVQAPTFRRMPDVIDIESKGLDTYDIQRLQRLDSVCKHAK